MVVSQKPKRVFPLISVKRPFLWIGALLLLYLFACVLSLASSGGRLTVYLDVPRGHEGKPEIRVEGSGIALENIETMPDGKLKVTVRSLEPGEADLNMRWQEDEDIGYALFFRTGPMHTAMEMGSMNFSGCHALVISTTIALILLALIVISHFFWRLQNDFYSYRTALTGGMGIYGAVVALLFLYVSQDWWHADAQGSIFSILGYFSSSGFLFMYISAPFLLLMCVGLFASNLSLIRHEGLHPANLLAAAAALLVIGGFILSVMVDNAFSSGSLEEYRLHACITSAVTTCFVFMEAMLLGTMLCGVIAAKREPHYDRDVVIIHGCKIAQDGTPLPLLRGRIDRALAFSGKQKEKTGKDLLFITSGGKGADECIAEGQCIANYLLSKGVSEHQMMIEDQSVSTLENMRYSKALIDQYFHDAHVAFSTTNYHVFRSGILARQVGLDAQGMGSKTKWYFWPNAFIREFVAMIAAERKALLIIWAEMVIFFTALTYFSVF